MADNSGLIKIGVFAGAAYLAYKQGWLSMLGFNAAVAPAAVAAATTTTVNQSTITGANSLDAIFLRLKALAPAGDHDVDGWNWVLAQAQPGITPPDPMPLFVAAVPNFSRSQLISAAQYWAVMAPALKTQLGLSGLGIYGGLGQVMRGCAR